MIIYGLLLCDPGDSSVKDTSQKLGTASRLLQRRRKEYAYL